jgi:hypothetical protein
VGDAVSRGERAPVDQVGDADCEATIKNVAGGANADQVVLTNALVGA